MTSEYRGKCPENMIADTVLYDEKNNSDCINKFRRKVTSYENIKTDDEKALTYSTDNYGADLACRNISECGNEICLNIVGGGILSRISLDKNKCTVAEVLACIGVLTAAGLPLAAISGYFTSDIKQ